MTSVETLSKTRVGSASGGYYHRFKHRSSSTGTDMTFGLYLPTSHSLSSPSSSSSSSSSTTKTSTDNTTPVLYWLSGLTCDDTNFANKAGSRAFVAAEREGIAIVMPDTSPRGEDVPDVDSYDMGVGAGFYVDATRAPYDANFKMYSYVTVELPSILEKEFDLGGGRLKSISGHSMGGHGALTVALNDPKSWVSVSALAPVSNPTDCPWGRKAFESYLGGVDAGKKHDATLLLSSMTAPAYESILVDVGTEDNFYDEQLKCDSLVEAAAEKSGQEVVLNKREGFDHSYHFVAAFVEDHVEFHGRRLNDRKKAEAGKDVE